MPPDLMESIGRTRPFGKIAPRRIYPLAPRDLHPVIRIAHRLKGPLRVEPRIIFDHELVLVLDGDLDLLTGSRRVALKAHHLCFLRPFVPHGFISHGVCEHVAVHFDMAPNFPPLARSLSRRPPYEVQFTHGLQVPAHVALSPADGIEAALLELLRLRAGAGDPLAELRATLNLIDVLAKLLKSRSSPTGGAVGDAVAQTRVRRSIAFAEEHLNQKLSAADLAQVAGLSAAHFTRVFRQWTGYSPMQYLRRLRVARAKQLLADIDLSIKEIAARSGFDDSYHFSKVFRQIDGLPPTRYRESILAGQFSQLGEK